MLNEILVMNDMTDSQKMLFSQKWSEEKKDRTTALLLTFFLGGFGGHKFYMGKTGLGLTYLIFFWTFIPGLIAFVELFLISGQVQKYNNLKLNEIANAVKLLAEKPVAS